MLASPSKAPLQDCHSEERREEESAFSCNLPWRVWAGTFRICGHLAAATS
jgi:hypothetical protein